MLSALVMQLLQCSALLPGASASKGIDLAESSPPSDSDDANSLEAAGRAAGQFVSSCLHKCATKSEDMDAKGVLLNLTADLLTVLTRPEWPAAALLLQALLATCLHQLRGQGQAEAGKGGKESKETTALKGVAVDLLREIAPAYKSLLLAAQARSLFIAPIIRAKEEEAVECLCGVNLGDRETRDMIACGTCNRWYHTPCVSVSASLYNSSLDWFCDACLIAKQLGAASAAAEEAKSDGMQNGQAQQQGADGQAVPEEPKEGAPKEPEPEEAPAKKRGGRKGVKRGAKAKEKEAEKEPAAAPSSNKKQKSPSPPPKPKLTAAQLQMQALQQLVLNFLLARQYSDAAAGNARHFWLCQIVADSGKEQAEDAAVWCRAQWVPPANLDLTSLARLSPDGTSQVVRYLLSHRLAKSFEAALAAVVGVMTDPSQALRTKALRALAAIVQTDPSVLALDRVRATVQERTQDISKAVREASIDLLGKYIQSAPHLTTHYFDTVAKRILDKGVLVRRKAVTILAEIAALQPNSPHVPDVCALLVGRVNDKDESIKKLVTQSFMEMWFKEGVSLEALQARVQQIVHVLGQAKNGPWFVSLLTKLLGHGEDKRERAVAGICQRMCEVLFGHILAIESSRAGLDKATPKFAEETKALVDTVTALSLFCKAAPRFLLPHVANLTFYLATSPSQPKGPHDPKIVELMAGMVAEVLPLVEHPSPESVRTLEENLTRLVCQQGMAVVPACVHCLGEVVSRVSQNAALMTELYHRFLDVLEKGKAAAKLDKAAIVRALFTLSLICKEYDLERAGGLKGVAGQVWPLYVYYRETFKHEPQVMVTAIQGMGPLFIAFPSLLQTASPLIRATLSSPLPALRVHMCRALLATLQHHADALLAAPSVDALEDTSTWVAHTGPDSTGAVSEHAEKVAELLYDAQEDVRFEALSLVTVMLKQGLIHPMQCIARLMALNCDHNPHISLRAYNLLAQIDDRHPDILWSRFSDGVRSSFDFQRRAFPSAGPIACRREGKETHTVWERVFLLPKKQTSQRAERTAFLSAMVKVFDTDDKHSPDLGYQRYVAELLAYLPYRIPEDPLSVVYHINKLLAMRGEPLLGQLKALKQEKEVPRALGEQCSSMCLLLILKNFLKVLYCLSENKCRTFLPNAGDSGKERKEKQLQPRSEVLERPSPFAALPPPDKAVEIFRAMMKADSTDTLVGLQPVAKRGPGAKRGRKKKEEADSEDESSEARPKPKKAKAKGPGKKRPRRKVNADDDGDEEEEQDSDEYRPD